MLEMWGFALGGPQHKLIHRDRTGEDSDGPNRYESAKLYVEGTPGFERTRLLLIHVHVQGLPVNSFRWRGPGETVLRALLTKDWGQFLGYPLGKTAERAYDAFVCALHERCLESPFEVRVAGKVA